MTSGTEPQRDGASDDHRRDQPELLSDFTARPFLLDWCEPAARLDVLDLGCGDGWFARALKRGGARTVIGIDPSPDAVRAATENETAERLGIEDRSGDACTLGAFPDARFDLVVAASLFNHLDVTRTRHAMREVHRVLRPGGRFVFAVAHPLLPFLGAQAAPFFFDAGAHGYFSGRNVSFAGRVWRRDGKSVPVRCVHKTLADHVGALQDAGFRHMPQLAELHATELHLALDPQWFEPLRDQPLHLAFQLTR